MKKKQLLFNENYIWMSYRYCIGKHTIAAHHQAETIANDVYGKITDARMEFFSEDICDIIHDNLSYKDFIDFDWYRNIPKDKFKPLDIVYTILNKENIDSIEKLKSIKSISINWNHEEQTFDHSIYYFNENDKNKDYGRSLWDLEDLEIWQKLANLLDKRTHKFCKLIDGSICEYYETWRMVSEEGKYSLKKYKCPVSDLNISILCYIPTENIKEDNIERKDS